MKHSKKILCAVSLLSFFTLKPLGENAGLKAAERLSDSLERSSAHIANAFVAGIGSAGKDLRETVPAAARPIAEVITITGNQTREVLGATNAVITNTGTQLRESTIILGHEGRSLIQAITNAPRSMVPHLKNIPLWSICTVSAVLGIFMANKGAELVIDNGEMVYNEEDKEQKKGIRYILVGSITCLASIIAIIHSEYIMNLH